MVNVHPAIKDSASGNSYGLMTIPLGIVEYTIQLLTPHLEGIHGPIWAPFSDTPTEKINQERSKGSHLVAGGSDGISIHSWVRLPLEVSLCTYTVILLCVLTLRKDNCNANNY